MSENTVFVIGAGASEEANLPTGQELKSRISELLDMRFDKWGVNLEYGDVAIMEALKIHVKQFDKSNCDFNSYLYEAWHIRDALPQAISIDNFIDAHRDNDKIVLCGKLAIVRSILDAEKNSLLYFQRLGRDSGMNFSAMEETWYIPFFQLLTENCMKSDLELRFKSITLIIFNYDRCVEHFLYYVLQNYYKLSGENAAELVKHINIYHPYGNVGNLPWINQGGVMEFGEYQGSEKLLELSKKIKTFAEGTNPISSEISEIRKHMGVANKVVFLGFAFHKLNMQLIAPENVCEKSISEIKCFATTYDISDSDKGVIKDQINELYRNKSRVSMANSTCGKFFAEYKRSLSF